uniref:Ras-GEF domain-containing protein n=1 Tax=Amphimedon queenslandica TaxID=400682 RepID=A0A1X7UNN3_AMPQE
LLRKLGSTDGRYKELKDAIRKATPPLIPYLALTMSELVSVSESASNYIEGDLVNFTKMRRYTRIIHSLLQHQKDPYDFNFDPEISKVLLTTELPGDENALYEYVDELRDCPLSPSSSSSSSSEQ